MTITWSRKILSAMLALIATSTLTLASSYTPVTLAAAGQASAVA